ncbi:unnamed protein product [Amoebophrya sp. A25]|nr:unnamed protein product [Amoebophrya sp. A25]|eukprot:GSA25T00021897001.1
MSSGQPKRRFMPKAPKRAAAPSGGASQPAAKAGAQAVQRPTTSSASAVNKNRPVVAASSEGVDALFEEGVQEGQLQAQNGSAGNVAASAPASMSVGTHLPATSSSSAQALPVAGKRVVSNHDSKKSSTSASAAPKKSSTTTSSSTTSRSGTGLGSRGIGHGIGSSKASAGASKSALSGGPKNIMSASSFMQRQPFSGVSRVRDAANPSRKLESVSEYAGGDSETCNRPLTLPFLEDENSMLPRSDLHQIGKHLMEEVVEKELSPDKNKDEMDSCSSSVAEKEALLDDVDAKSKDASKKEKNAPNLGTHFCRLNAETMEVEDSSDFVFLQTPYLLPAASNVASSTQSPAEQGETTGTTTPTTQTTATTTTAMCYPSGEIGELRMHKSGKLTMRIGPDLIFEIDRGLSKCAQQLMAICPYQDEALFLGGMEETLTVRPSLS